MSKRILIIEVNWLGDVIFTTPFIRAVREHYPGAYIACLIHPRCVDVIDGNPRINEIIIYDEQGVHKGLIGKIKLILELRKKRFDIAFVLHRSFTKALIALFAGIPERVGHPTKKRSMILTKTVEENTGSLHKVEYFLDLARAMGAHPAGLSYEFYVKEPDKIFVREFLKRHGVGEGEAIVTICPGGNWDPKRWPRGRFAQLSDELVKRYGVRIVIAGAKKDIALAEEIKRMMKEPAVIAAGATTLKELGAIFARSKLVIANDTGPMHIAVAMKTRVIALFGPTSPDITGPYGGSNCTVIHKNRECQVPCYDDSCDANRCMEDIGVQDVLDAAGKYLS